MKPNFLLLLLFFNSFLFSQSNKKSVKVTYEYYCCKPLQYDVELISNQKMSKFTNFHKEEHFDMDWYKLKINEIRHLCFYNSDSKKYIQNGFSYKNEVYAYWLDNYDWKITNEKKEILGYKVVKATRKAKHIQTEDLVVAWFCPDIPFFTGPMDFVGLPGLVLEASITGRGNYTAKKIDFFDKEFNIIPEKRGIEVSEYYIKNPLNIKRSYLRKQAKKNKSK